MTHHHRDPASAPPDLLLESHLVEALHRRAALAPEAEAVHRGAEAERGRRQRRIRAGAALAAVALAAVGVPQVVEVVRAVRPQTSAISSAAPTTSSAAPTASAPLPWTVPADAASLPGTALPAALAPGEWDQQDVDAFYAAGYTYADAVALAEIWGRPGEAVHAKVTAGQRLRAGQTLPVTAGQSPPYTDPSDAWRTFADSGRGVDDALALARLWELPSGYQGAVKAGTMLLAGGSLPSPSAGGEQQQEQQAYAQAGYDKRDTTALATLWGLGSSGEVEQAAGANLLAGQPVPVTP